MVQVPTDSSVAVEFAVDAVQTVGVVEAKLTGRPEPAVAVRVTGTDPLMAWAGIELNVIVWAARLTVKLWVTTAAAAYTALPGWAAWIVHVPAASSDAIEPETVQMVGVEEVKMTDSPELAVAVNAMVELAVCAPIDPKVTLCVSVPVPIPFKVMVCTAYPGAAAFSALSISASVPFKDSAAEGAKLMES